MPSISVGVDPGLSGGIAILGGASPVVVSMPVTGGDIDAHAIATLLRSECPVADTVVGVELVHAMPRQGVSSSFSFGKGFGIVLGVVASLGLRLELIQPNAWKKRVLAGLIPQKKALPKDATAREKAAASAEHKRQSKQAAIAWVRRAYPNVSLIEARCRTPNDGMAEAVCIAEFVRLNYANAAGPH